MGGIFNSDGPDKQNYQPINIDQDLKARYLGIIDKYMKDKGMVDAIPQENRPYELRDPRDRGDWRAATGNQVNSQGGIQQPTLNDGVFFNRPQAVNTTPPTDKPSGMQMPEDKPTIFKDAPSIERSVSSQVMPQVTNAPNLNQVPLTTNTAFFQEDQRRKQEEYNKVKDYVYRDSRR